MKKILGLLGSIALVVPTSSSIVACESVKKLEFAKGKSVNDLIEFVNDGYIDEEDKKILDDSVCLSKIHGLTREERRILKGAGDIYWFIYNESNNNFDLRVKKFNEIKNLFKNLNKVWYLSLIDNNNQLHSYFSVDNAKEGNSTFTLKLIQIHVEYNHLSSNNVKITFKNCIILYKTTIDLKKIK